MAEKEGIRLTEIEGFPEDAARQLSDLWITTAEELVAASKREDAMEGLQEYLDLSEDEIEALVDQAQDALPFEVHFAPEEIERHGLGALDEPEDEDPEPGAFAFATLPASVDLRDRMPAVRNQQNRGTCVAFACTAVREYLLGEETSAQGDLSEQFLYWNCKQRDGYAGSGTWIRVGMEALKDDGICVESVWPYNPDPIPGNEGQGPPPADALNTADDYRVDASAKLRARWVDDLRQRLADGLPVAFAVPVYTYWFTDPIRRTGDIRLPLSTDNKEGGHAMCMVGYEDDDDVPGGGYFYVRNSWGESWGGESPLGAGHARIPYAYMEQYASSAYVAHVEKDEEPEPEPEPTTGLFALLEKLWEWLMGLFS
jgi:C1A family cysteine protease